MQFRDLTAQDVEVRVAQVKEGKGCSLLLYKNARCDMNILDETFGMQNWQREHYECKGNLFCRVGIRFDEEWIWKSDCGTESNTEAQKGEASDSFKRACFNWGIGRELYTAPFIWVKNGDVQLNGKKTYDKFNVSNIAVQDKRIVALDIENTNLKKCVFSWRDGKGNSVRGADTPSPNEQLKPPKETKSKKAPDYLALNADYCSKIAAVKKTTAADVYEKAKATANSEDYKEICKVLYSWMRKIK